MRMDWDKIEDKGFTIYPKGPYTVKIEAIEEVQASTGNNQLKIITKIMTPDEHNGKKYTEFITLVPSCDWKLKNFIAGCGIDMTTLPSMDTTSGDFRQLLNKLIGKTSVWIVDEKADRDGTLRNNTVAYEVDPNASTAVEDVPEFLSEDGSPEEN